MKNSEKKALIGNIFSKAMPILKTAVSGLNPLIGAGVGLVDGATKAIKEEKEKNLATPIGGEGNVNYSMMLGQFLSALIIIGGGFAVIMGWLTFEDVKDFVKLWNSTQ
jgi:hypothetical protein